MVLALLMGDFDYRMDIASGGIVGLDGDGEGIHGRDQIIEDLVGRFFVGDIAIAVAVDIQLERLEFYHLLVWRIGDVDGRKVRVAREGTFAGKFGQGNVDVVFPTRSGVRKGGEIAINDLSFAVLHFRRISNFAHSRYIYAVSLPMVAGLGFWCYWASQSGQEPSSQP
jgi:hypothetical protein